MPGSAEVGAPAWGSEPGGLRMAALGNVGVISGGRYGELGPGLWGGGVEGGSVLGGSSACRWPFGVCEFGMFWVTLNVFGGWGFGAAGAG